MSKLLTVDKLRTALDGGGSCLWVPEADVALGTRTIRSAGTYYAADDGFYGYSRVTVKGIGSSVTGKMSDGSGDEATATVDPETGEVTISKIPSSIKVITPPENEYGIYQVGQAIDTAGMVVKGYTASGEEWGTVPLDEITLSPTTAVYDEETEYGGSYAVSDLLSYRVPLGDFIPSIELKKGPYGIEPLYALGYDGYYRSSRSVYAIVVSAEAGERNVTEVNCNWDENLNVTYTEHDYSAAHYNKFTYDGKTVWWEDHVITAASVPWHSGYGDVGANAEELEIHSSSDEEVRRMAWTIMYGEKVTIPYGSRQTITASWARPGDGKVLTAEFEIMVAPGYEA